MRLIPQMGLAPLQFAEAFPFHLAFDRHFAIRQFGRSLSRLCPNLTEGSFLFDYFNLERPALGHDFDTLIAYQNQLFVFDVIHQNVKLRGQIIHQANTGTMLFLGSPWLTEPGQISRLGLTFDDFALHDAVIDLLQVMQAQNMALADTRKLAEKLSRQRTELRESNAALKAEIDMRRQTEEILQESENTFLTLLESASEGIVIVSDRGNVEMVNARLLSMFDYPRAEIIGQPIELLIPGRFAENHKRERIEFMHGPRNRPMGATLDLFGRRKDGSEFPVDISLSYVHTHHGLLVMGFVSDMTDRRRAAEELETERNFALRVMNAMGQGLAVIGADLKFEYVNPAFAEMLSYQPEQIIGKMPASFTHADDMDLLEAAFNQCFSDTVLTCESRLMDAANQIVPVLLTLTPHHREGRVIGIIAVVTNLAERKRIEEALAHARDKALEASRLKSEFLATMSHEIRTPMNSIIGITDLLIETGLEGEQKKFAELVQESANALLTIINDILDTSKIEAGKLELESIEFDFQSEIDVVIALLQPKAQKKALGLRTKVSPMVPNRLIGDPGRIRQVLFNLLSNSIKFTNSGSVILSVDLKIQEGQKATLHFSVKDSGIGIAANVKEQLFQPFMQADRSTTRKFGGTGLGLAITKKIVDLMEGSIGVDSEEGVGSIFWFEVALEVAPELPERNPAPKLWNEDSSEYPVKRPKASSNILLVEDNEVNTLIALRMLERLGYAADRVSNGREAVEAVQQKCYTLLLMDCQMPEMDGLDATRAIRAWEAAHGGHVTIVAMTANAMVEDRALCLSSGMDDYLSKPVDRQSLSAVLEKWLVGTSSTCL